MKLVKKRPEYTIYQRRDDRYAIETKKGNAINGDDKIKILPKIIKIYQNVNVSFTF